VARRITVDRTAARPGVVGGPSVSSLTFTELSQPEYTKTAASTPVASSPADRPKGLSQPSEGVTAVSGPSPARSLTRATTDRSTSAPICSTTMTTWTRPESSVPTTVMKRLKAM
jgi:hypothetical protein